VYLFPGQQNISRTQIDWLLKPRCQGFVWACTLCYWYNILVWLIDALNNDRHERGLLNDSHCWPVTLLTPLYCHISLNHYSIYQATWNKRHSWWTVLANSRKKQ
jgi:hypothetical protein